MVALPDARTLAATLIRQHEGLRLTVYDDATGLALRKDDKLAGHPSIGYGRNLDIGRGITKDEAEHLLDNDLTVATAIAQRFAGEACWARLDPVRQAVLIDMGHNLGSSRLAGFVRLQQAVQAGDYEVAAAEMLDSIWAGQVGARARALAEMMLTGEVADG